MILKCEILRIKTTFKTMKVSRKTNVKFSIFSALSQTWHPWLERKFIYLTSPEMSLYRITCNGCVIKVPESWRKWRLRELREYIPTRWNSCVLYGLCTHVRSVDTVRPVGFIARRAQHATYRGGLRMRIVLLPALQWYAHVRAWIVLDRNNHLFLRENDF